MRSIIVVAVALLFGGVAYAMSKMDGMGEPHCWRYRITVEINTPEGIKDGSAVREACLTAFEGYNPSVADFKEKVTGEAVAVDLGERGVVFAIMDQDGSIFDIENAFDGPKLFSKEGAEYYSQLETGAVGELKSEIFSGYPTLITFKDINDPKTLTVLQDWSFRAPPYPVTYFETENNMSLLGDGVTVNRIFLEITDAPITERIEPLLEKFGGGAGPYDRSRFQRGDKT